MDREFFAQFLTETHFPRRRRTSCWGPIPPWGKGQQEALEGAVETFYATSWT